VETSKERLKAVHKATVEVASAVMTAVATTVISFLPVFTMEAAEGKLFRPLAFTKTFALIAALLTSLLVLPAAAHLVYKKVNLNNFMKTLQIGSLVILSALCLSYGFYLPSFLFLIAVFGLLKVKRVEPKKADFLKKLIFTSLASLVLVYLIAFSWMPLGLEKPVWLNFLLVALTFGAIMGAVFIFQAIYTPVLSWALRHKIKFLTAPIITVILGVISWQSLGKEFMPALDEGSFLLMPSTTPHAAISESKELMRKIDALVKTIPEVDSVVGKLGRVDSALDPAPISMYENIVNYKSEYIVGKDGHPLRFKYNYAKKEFVRDKDGKLIPDPDGMPYRQWRKHIRTPDDIWKEIIDKISSIKGITIPPKLQPIETRVIMLQTGMRAPIGIKIKGPDLKTIEKVGIQLEGLLKNVPAINPKTVSADRITSKPYLEIAIDREKIARYGLAVKDVLDVIEVAIGGKPITVTVEGRERYPVRVRYLRELRDSPETLTKILVPAKLQMKGKMVHKVQVPLGELAEVKYVPKSQVIKSEDTFLVGYLVFDKNPGWAEVDVVEQAQKFIQEKIKSGEFKVPKGVTLTFAGNYENQIRAEKKLMVVVPIALFVIFLILYFQFNSSITATIVFSGILVAWAGGFILLWCYNQPWFMNISLLGYSIREIFNIKPYNLSTAVWVGFIALFGIASDNGVLIATLIKQRLEQTKERSVEIIREAVLTSAKRRIRPALMTTAATMLALMPVLTSTGRGSDIMVPMAIPSFGGVLFSVITLFVVPVLYSWTEEIKLKFLSK
ncbi:MAG: efflux RND transporter permease subunit, partial [Candidatus Dadabacteria bacterium]